MSKVHVKKDDTVLVLAGKDRGKKGKVLAVDPGKMRVVVEGVNVVKRHMKPRPPQVPQGGIVEKSLGVHASNLALQCPKCSKTTRRIVKVGVGTRTPVCKKCGEEI